MSALPELLGGYLVRSLPAAREAPGRVVVRQTGRMQLRPGGRVPAFRAKTTYAELGGVRVPTVAEVAWELADGPFTYFSARVEAVEAVADSAATSAPTRRTSRTKSRTSSSVVR